MSGRDAGAALCAPFLDHLPVTGLSVSVVSDSGSQSTVGTSDLIAARLDELQFELGEGPTSDVLLLGRPVLTPDLADDRVRRDWPVFGVAALGTGARALFSFPMLNGVFTVGVVSLYSVLPRPPWSDAEVRTATGLVRATTGPAVQLATRSATDEARPTERLPAEMRREVHQASGMLMVQLDCSIAEATSRLRAYAFSRDRPIDMVARDVVTGMLDFRMVDD
ncbi:GAF and ANTAR domain-containing protein [uncultured Amnibacterium sp.]|uniref:GAF and ANTAR domain-containing protein n=1 Tax=uncultured Amnibacterium sp. TaxID=1631851 RepID=UPI0035CAC523